MEAYIEYIGWFGAVAFTLCGAPMAYDAWRDQCADRINNLFLFLWTVGDIALLIYAIYYTKMPLIADYALNAVFVAYIYYIKFKYRNN